MVKQSIRIGLNMSGVDHLEAGLRQLPTGIRKNVLRRALLKAAQPMVDAMEAAAPTNRLRVRITASPTLSKRQRAASRPKREKWAVTIYVGSRPLRHAHLVEFGSGPRYNKKGAYRGIMPPHPYVRPGFDASHGQVLQRLGEFLGVEIERSAERWRRKQARQAIKVNGGA